MGKNGNFRLTRLERNWILYDVGNSAFVLMVATLIPIFFNALAESGGLTSVEYLAYWGYASSVVTIITAILSPILGTVADTRGFKKPIFMLCVGVGIVGCCAMGAASAWLPFLVIFVIAKVGFSGSLVFYDSMLGDVTTPERMDEVSSRGYAWGYIGSCVPFVASLGLILGADAIGISGTVAMMIAFFINASWWVVVTLPLLRNYQQKYYVEAGGTDVRGIFSRLGKVFAEIRDDKKVLWFLAAFFFYIDGVYTIIEMATSYGKDVGISDTSLLMALLLTQVVAFPCAILFGKLTQRFASSKLISVCIGAYFVVAVYALWLDAAWKFWMMATFVGVFQGAIQALSRSYYAKMGMPVEIVKLHGNIELAPITGMAERIIDITATGTTLRENNLVVVDDVLASTARFFANPCSYRTNPRVGQLADVLYSQTKEN